jgi:hypothetical protein
LVAVAGDLFDSPTPGQADVSAVCAAVGAIPCPVVVIPGNHDHGGPGSVWHSPYFRAERNRRAANLEVLLRPTPLELETAVILPCPLLRRRDSGDPCGWLQGVNWAQLPAAKPRLVLAHGSVHGFGATDLDGSSDNVNNRLRLEGPWLHQVDYVALGDWHGVKQVSDKAWYCGSPEPDRFPRSADYRSGLVLQARIGRGMVPQVTPLGTGVLGWHPLRVQLHQDGDLDRLEDQLETLLGGRIGSDLLLLEVSGSLSLAGHRRYAALLERLEAQLLRLKLRGHCQAAPGEAELAELTQRPCDPLVARVASELQQAIATGAGIGVDALGAHGWDPALLRLALTELHHTVGQLQG